MLCLSLLFLLIISFISFLAQNVLFKFAMDYFDKAASGLAELGELVEGDLSGLEVVEGEVGCSRRGRLLLYTVLFLSDIIVLVF